MLQKTYPRFLEDLVGNDAGALEHVAARARGEAHLLPSGAEDRGVANVVARHQMIGVVHTGWVNREPINYTQRPVVRADELHLRQHLIHVVLVPALHHKRNLT
ncbi:unnamed protein product, partial [Heterotrigona itama]